MCLYVEAPASDDDLLTEYYKKFKGEACVDQYRSIPKFYTKVRHMWHSTSIGMCNEICMGLIKFVCSILQHTTHQKNVNDYSYM